MGDSKIEFKDNYQPGLKSGKYKLDISAPVFSWPKTAKNPAGSEILQKPDDFHFVVHSERFSISPKEVDSVFPPSGSLGDFSNVLPHVVLNRSSLPWERTPVKENGTSVPPDLPWLALLVFEEDELEPQKNAAAKAGLSYKVSDIHGLGNTKESKVSLEGVGDVWPGISIEDKIVPSDTDLLNLIFVKKSTLEGIIPQSTRELRFLCHTRQLDGNVQGMKAIIMANRIPSASKSAIVHLVSMEHRYQSGEDGGFIYPTDPTASDDDLIPLISLKSWRFSCLSARHNFRGRMLGLNHQLLFRIPNVDSSMISILKRKQIPSKVRQALANAGFPLDELTSQLEFKEGYLKLKLNNHYYLIDEEGSLYNQAGVQMSRLNNFIFVKDKLPAKRGYEDTLAGDLAALLKLDKSTLLQDNPFELAPTYFWIEDEPINSATPKDHFFLEVEGADLLCHRLFSDNKPNIRLPETGNPQADAFLRQGYAALPHHFRKSGVSVSWYKGPLSTGSPSIDNDLPANDIAHWLQSRQEISPSQEDYPQVTHGDHLLRYDPATGFFDTTYAAAWELGRLLALRNKGFSTYLVQWKHSHRRFYKMQEKEKNDRHIVQAGPGKVPDPGILQKWLDALLNLEGIPFNYLVPDERMLPTESLRFFYLDPNWMTCLILGGLSFGGKMNRTGMKELLSQAVMPKMGFLMRSSIVSGWPGLQVEPIPQATISPINRSLDPNLMLYLFHEDPDEIDFSLKPNVIHHGFYQNEVEGAYWKKLRNSVGHELGTLQISAEKDDLSNNFYMSTTRRLQVQQLVIDMDKIPPPPKYKDPPQPTGGAQASEQSISEKLGFGPEITPAQFALSLIEGADKFKWKKKAR